MRELLAQSVDQMRTTIDRFPWEERSAYAGWLAQTYYYVRHSTRLLAAAAARFAMDDRGSVLHHRFTAHMREEKKHELLALHDLKKIGGDIEDYPEYASTRMFYEPQYYKVEHCAPIALFGYILPLEAIGPARGPLIASRVSASLGSGCASFVQLHAEEDDGHLAKALALLEALDGTERRLVEDNVQQTAHAYCEMLHDIRRQLDRRVVNPGGFRGSSAE
jgi:hypothetical protein